MEKGSPAAECQNWVGGHHDDNEHNSSNDDGDVSRTVVSEDV